MIRFITALGAIIIFISFTPAFSFERDRECPIINKKLRLLEIRQHSLESKDDYYGGRLKFVKKALDLNSRDFRLCQQYYAGMGEEPELSHMRGPAFRAFPDCVDVIEIFEDDSINYAGIKAKLKAINDRVRAVSRQQNDLLLRADAGRCLETPEPVIPELLPTLEEEEAYGEVVDTEQRLEAQTEPAYPPYPLEGEPPPAVTAPSVTATAPSVTAEGLPSLLFQSFTVPNDKPVKVVTKPLEKGRWYEIEVSGTVSDWEGYKDGLDAVWCYAEWRCGKEGEPWNQLRIDGRGMTGIEGQHIPYEVKHTYRIRYRGEGKSLQFLLSDAQWSPEDNSGAITVNIFRVR